MAGEMGPGEGGVSRLGRRRRSLQQEEVGGARGRWSFGPGRGAAACWVVWFWSRLSLAFGGCVMGPTVGGSRWLWLERVLVPGRSWFGSARVEKLLWWWLEVLWPCGGEGERRPWRLAGQGLVVGRFGGRRRGKKIAWGVGCCWLVGYGGGREDRESAWCWFSGEDGAVLQWAVSVAGGRRGEARVPGVGLLGAGQGSWCWAGPLEAGGTGLVWSYLGKGNGGRRGPAGGWILRLEVGCLAAGRERVACGGSVVVGGWPERVTCLAGEEKKESLGRKNEEESLFRERESVFLEELDS